MTGQMKYYLFLFEKYIIYFIFILTYLFVAYYPHVFVSRFVTKLR